MTQPKNIFENLSRYEIKSATIGMILGDSNIQMRATNARMQIAHTPKVEDYVQLKAKVLGQIPGVTLNYTHVMHNNRKLGKIYPQIRAWSTTHKYFTNMSKRFYKPEKKVTKEILNALTPMGLAFWYMDDGSLTLHHNVVRSKLDESLSTQERSISSRTICLHTQGFSYEEQELIVTWLKDEHSIDARIKPSKKKNWKIFMNTTNAKKFVDVVRPYVLAVPSMHYKIDFKYVKDDSTLLKYNADHWTTEEGQERLALRYPEMMI